MSTEQTHDEDATEFVMKKRGSHIDIWAVVDYVPVETPDGRVQLNISDPSCMECREDVIRQLAARGLEQESLDSYV